MRTPQLQKQLDKLCDQYDKAADLLLAEARAKYVVPYCDKHGLRFTSGMGTFCFDGGPDAYIYSEDLPKRLLAVLMCEIHTSRNDAGSLMEDYTPANYKGFAPSAK